MTLVDTGYLVALLVPRDSLHPRAIRWSRSVAGPLLVSEYVIWETINYLSPLVDRPKTYLLIDEIETGSDYEFIRATRELFRAGVDLHRTRPDKAWSLTDCISFHLMNQRGISRALSHDHHFEQAGFEALLRSDPPA